VKLYRFVYEGFPTPSVSDRLGEGKRRCLRNKLTPTNQQRFHFI